MSAWVTYEQAAEILRCHVSNVPKLIRKGQLHSRGGRGPAAAALDRLEVEDLARRRAARLSRTPVKASRAVDRRPDPDHEWLSVPQVAQRLGVTRPAVAGRINRGRLPATESHGRYWVRADHLELVERARQASRTKRP